MKSKIYLPEKNISSFFSLRSVVTFIFLGVILLENKKVHSQSTSLSFTQLTGDFSRPQAGAEQWHYDWIVPVSGVTVQDKYWRFNWAGLNPGDGVYNWTYFDQQINACISAGQKFSFGIMTQYDGGAGSPGIVSFDGGASAYPKWVHDQMQTEPVKDWLYGGHDWVPNWNSNYYLTALEKFNIALNNHLMTGSYNGVAYKNVINYIDIRGYGNFGEWHGYPWKDSEPAGTAVTAASLIRIIDAHKNGFPNFQLQAMIAGFDPGSWSKMPPEVTYKLLTDSNNAGQFGWRRDSWGNTEPWYPAILENNPNSYNGKAFKDLIMNKWKYAPVTGEPCCNDGYADLLNQVNRYHVNSFGNGNYGNVTGANVVAASKACGYRLILKGGDVETESQLLISLDWQNIGVAPTYEDWKVIYQLTDSNNLAIWNGTSTFNPKLFIGEKKITDSFPMPVLKNGTYRLSMTIKDPNNYRQPLPLAIRGRNPDGSYTLTNINIPTSNPKDPLQ